MKSQTIKIILLISVLTVFSSLRVLSQFYSWTAPQPISDSTADNRNPLIFELPLEGYYDYYLFWERSPDSNSTAIYYRNFYDAGEAFPLMEDPNIHFRNPRFLLTDDINPDTLFYFFYESDQNGNFDLYYRVFTSMGFGDPVLLDGSPEEVSHFRCNISKVMTWQLGDKIKTARLLYDNTSLSISDIFTIDSVNCSSPDLPPGYGFNYYTYLAWLKGDSLGNTIYYSEHNNNSWSIPQILYDTGYNTSLSFAHSACTNDDSFGYVLSWDNMNGVIHTIKAMDLYDGDFTSDFTQAISFLPDISIYIAPRDELYQQGFLSFVYDNEQNGDIYVNEEGMGIFPEISDYINLTNSPYKETNPAIFTGRWNLDDRDQILIWESQRNSHWQMFYSTNAILCTGGTNESSILPIYALKVSPNPVRNNCVIHFTLPENGKVSLKIYTVDGKEIILMGNQFMQKGDHEYDLDLNRFGSAIPHSGLLLIKLETPTSSAGFKLLRVQ